MRRLQTFILVGALVLAGCGGPPPKIAYTVNDPKDPNTTWRTERPLTYAEAISAGKCPISLPEKASNIQYVDFYAGYTGFAQIVRFEAPVSVCREHARKVLETFNAYVKQESMKVSVHALAFDRSMAKSLSDEARWGMEDVARAPWFDTDAIRSGEIWGQNESHKPIILIDTDRGVFYFLLSD